MDMEADSAMIGNGEPIHRLLVVVNYWIKAYI